MWLMLVAAAAAVACVAVLGLGLTVAARRVLVGIRSAIRDDRGR